MSRIFITGSVDGLGLATGKTLLSQGHEVIFHARSEKRAEALNAVAAQPRVVTGDLASAEAVRAMAERLNHIGPMDAVIHNAGVYRQEARAATPEGHAVTLAINTLAPYQLTALMHRPKRLIYLSSGLHRDGEGSLSDIDWVEREWDSAKAYAESKLHAVALASALSRRWADVICSAVDPGWVRTKMGGAAAPRDIEAGQATQAWLAMSEDPAAKVSGGYWHDQRREAPAREATDTGFQDRLLEKLAVLTGVPLP